MTPPSPSDATRAVVTLRGLGRKFGQVDALREVDLEIPAGPVGLLGPNGAGKSTLLKVLLGLLPPTTGSASVLGVDPVRDPREVRRRVGYMPETDAFLTGLTGVESVAFAGVLSGLPRGAALQRAHRVLDYVGLEEVRYRRVEEYSTGMRQRVRLGQALVHDPELLFLDEPTNGLDPEGREEILAVVRDLATRHGKNVILCSHLLRDVEAVCAHVVLLLQGRVGRRGTMEEVRGGRSGVYRATGRGATDAFVAELLLTGCTVEPGPGHLKVAVPDGAGTGPVLRAAVGSGYDLRSVAPDSLTLEDAFVAAVGSVEEA